MSRTPGHEADTFSHRPASGARRGNSALRRLDRRLGPVILAILAPFVRASVWASRRKSEAGAAKDAAVLVVCYGALGDLLLVAEAARSVLRGRRVVLACTESNRAASRLADSPFDEVAVVSMTSPFALSRLADRAGCSLVVDTSQWSRVSAIQCAFLRLRHPRTRVAGFWSANRPRYSAYSVHVRHRDDVHEVENFAACLAAGAPHDVTADALVAAQPPRAVVDGASRVMLLHPWPSGTRAHLKEWPAERWIELAERAIAAGYTVELSGGPDDRDRNAEMVRRSGLPLHDLAGRYTLAELDAHLRADVDLCVAVNTGIMHLAALGGVPVVAVTGPTSPRRWGPLGRHSVSVLPGSGPVAYLHFGWEYPPRDEDAYALDRLTTAEVWTAVEKIADEAGVSTR